MAERRRLYAPPGAFGEGRLRLEGELLRRARTVLRLRAGDELDVTDGAGGEYRVRIERLGRDEGSASVLERGEPRRESPLATVLAQAVPKGDRFALALEKAVELGVATIVPLVSGRSVARGAGAQAVARWRRIVESATAQSGRTRLPDLREPRTWGELVEDRALADLRVLLWERAAGGLRAALADVSAPRSALVAVGPEGGLCPAEVDAAAGAGFLVAHLGPRILRTETAGIAALAAVQHRWGDLG